MATCPKCGTSILPNAGRCARCGASAGGPNSLGGAAAPSKALLIVVLAGAVSTAGMGAAVFLLMRAPAPPPAAREQPTSELPPAPPTPEPAEVQDRIEAALQHARRQLVEAKAGAGDDATREQLEAALRQTDGMLAKARQDQVAPPAPPAGAARCEPQEVAQISRRNQRALRACYERSLKRDPRLSGRLVLEVKVDPAGKVQSVEFGEGAMADVAMRQCSQMFVSRWTFPATAEGCRATLVYNFASSP